MSQADVFANKAKTVASSEARGTAYYVRRTMIYLVGGYLLLCAVLFLIQRRLVFQPTREAAVKPQEYAFGLGQALPLLTKTPDGVTLRGWHITGGRTRTGGHPQNLKDAALVTLFFCGNGGHRGFRGGSFRQLATLGTHVVCFDYRGYGDSEGSPTEEGLAIDARAAWDYLIAQGVEPTRIVVHGESLGGGVAIRLAHDLCKAGTPPAALVTEATFASLADAAAQQYFFVPVKLLLRDRFPSIERITTVTCPILMFHGRKDEIVAYEQGERLFSAAPAASASGVAKTFVSLPEATHNDVPFAHPQEFRGALQTLYAGLAPELKITERPELPAKNRERRPRGERRTPPAAPPKVAP